MPEFTPHLSALMPTFTKKTPQRFYFAIHKLKHWIFKDSSWQLQSSVVARRNKHNSNQIREQLEKEAWERERKKKGSSDELWDEMWGSLLTCGPFHPEKCDGSPRCIFIAGSLATALPRLGYSMQSALAGKTEKYGPTQNISLHHLLWRAAHTHMLKVFMNV